ncbi:frataxin, mitochondrial-like [Oscarella lobularis]|uniref:frataxin, mitochondrial-like n=1 Tax=Oscarella lobularis TaxID=121494 RepID=UPI003313EDB7
MHALMHHFSLSITLVDFHHKSEATLDELAEYFESLPETDINCDENYDVHLSDGVLTISLGKDLGTYVINKQTPNRQLWFSSPLSGPKRYDFLNGNWIYKRDGMSLHSRLTTELTQLYGKPVDLMHLLAKEVGHN